MKATQPTPAESDETLKRRLDKYRQAGRPRPYAAFATLGIFLLVVGGGYLWWRRTNGQTVTNSVQKILSAVTTSPLSSATAAPTVPDPLTGEPITAAQAKQPIVGVMIENLYPDARPQSGLGEAGVVYEALAEGGITRFLGIFQEPFPQSIGPVRSLRPYYLTWGLEYNAPVVHAGGSQPALADIRPSGLKNIDALAIGAPTFLRTSDRLAPHNLYSKASVLSALLTKLHWDNAPTFTPLARKTDAPMATPTHPTIAINFSTSAYKVGYAFDAATDSYARTMGATPHIDRNSGKQIMVKNIVVEFVPTSYSKQQDGKPETDMGLIGSGKAIVFEDGGAIVGSWSKASQKAQTKLIDGNGAPISFNAGTTWYEVVPIGTTISY